MIRTPRISVVIPAFNHEKFIGEALASVQAQTFDDFEIVVIDDGSSDGTAAVAQAYTRNDTRVRVLNQPNGGSHSALNRGIAEARGHWIAVLNSDDRFAPTRLERMLAAAQAGARFVVSDARLIDAQGDPINDARHWWHLTLSDFLAKVDEVGPIEGLMYGNFTVSTSNFFFERSLAEDIGPFRPLRRVIDWDWALRAALHAPDRFRHLRGEYLLDYRLHGNNAILGDPLRGILEINRVHRQVLRALKAPATLLASQQRNRRELRRAWRDRHVARVEQFLREREARVALLESGVREREAQIGVLEGVVREREAQIALLDGMVRERDEQVSQLQTERNQLSTELTRSIDQVNAQTEVSVALRARLDRIEQSLPWRTLGALKRLANRFSR